MTIFCPHVGPHEILSTGRSRAKRLLSACSLTCFYWATQCRRRIFRFLALRSYEDIRTLRTFMPSPPPRFPRILAQVRFLLGGVTLGYIISTLFYSPTTSSWKTRVTEEIITRSFLPLHAHVLGPLPPLPADPCGRRDVKATSDSLQGTSAYYSRALLSLQRTRAGEFQFNDRSDFIALLQGLS